MGYSEIKPSPILKHLIQCYWRISTAQNSLPGERTIMPDGCFDIVIDFNPLRKNDVILTGIWDRPISVNLLPGQITAGIRFYPAAIDVFFNCRVANYNNSATTLNASMLKGGENTIGTTLFECKEPEDLLTFCDSWFVIAMASQTNINPFLVKGQESLPGDSVELFSELSGVSARQLRRLYKNRFGISTKTYLRILRFLKAKELLMMPATKELAEIAAECQYADQAHLIKEFHRFTGITPTSFRNRYLMSDFYNTARR